MLIRQILGGALLPSNSSWYWHIVNVRQSTVLWRWQTDWAGLESRQHHAVMESLKWIRQQRHRNGVSLLLSYLPNFHLISWDKYYTLSITRSGTFSGYIWKACSSWINFMNSDEIIPWGFQETARTFSIKRDYMISVGGSSNLEAYFATLRQYISVPRRFHTW